MRHSSLFFCRLSLTGLRERFFSDSGCVEKITDNARRRSLTAAAANWSKKFQPASLHSIERSYGTRKTVCYGACMPTEKMQTPPFDMDDLVQRIVTLAAHIDAATSRLLDMILDFDRREGWAEQHARSCVEWLRRARDLIGDSVGAAARPASTCGWRTSSTSCRSYTAPSAGVS